MGHCSAESREWSFEDPEAYAGQVCNHCYDEPQADEKQIFANLRPCKFASKTMVEWSPIRRDLIEGVDFMLIRENCGGAYYGDKVERDDYGCDPWEYSRPEIERVARVAAALALQHNPPLPVWSVDKANVLANSRVWRRVVNEVFEKEFPRLKVQHQLADSLAMLLITKPTAFNGIIFTDNTFGTLLRAGLAASDIVSLHDSCHR